MYVVNGSDGRCLVAVRLIVGVRYLERPLREVLLYIYIYIYRIARNFRGLKFLWIGLPENFHDFIFADGRFD